MKIKLPIVSTILFLVLCQSAMAAKCMLVMSYHKGYEWNDGVQQGVEKVLHGKCDLKIFYMDTKRQKGAEHAIKMAEQARKVIGEYQPDVLIASDDNVSRYLIAKYYKNASLPVVFCAVNWDVSKYGYPYNNVTGMIEVAPIQPLIEVARTALGDVKTMSYLGADTFTETKNAKRVTEVVQKQGVTVNSQFANTVADWKRLFIQSQAADFVMLGSNAGIGGWDNEEIAKFVKANAKKMVVTNHSWMAPFSMYAMTKVPEEQGEWAAEAALAIMNGLPPGKIPIRINRKWKTYINTPLLKQAGINGEFKKIENAIEVDGRSQLD